MKKKTAVPEALKIERESYYELHQTFDSSENNIAYGRELNKFGTFMEV